MILQTTPQNYIDGPNLELGKPKCLKFLQQLVSQPKCRDTVFWFLAKTLLDQRVFLLLAKKQLGNRSISCYPLNSNAGMHGRYVFKIRCGVTCDKGF